MKLFYSPHSPYVRKVLICAEELGLADRIELLTSAAGPVVRDATIVAINPLGQVPTFLTDDGELLADSRVICEYLNELAGGTMLGKGPERWRILTDASVAEGLTNAALLLRYEEALRPADKFWQDWHDGQMAKVTSVLDHFEAGAAALAGRADLVPVTLAAGLSYLDHRFPHVDWRAGHPALAAWYAAFSDRPSMQATRLGVDRMAA